MRISISSELAEILLDLFRDNLEAGMHFEDHIIEDYDKFQHSVWTCKRRTRINNQVKIAKERLEKLEDG